MKKTLKDLLPDGLSEDSVNEILTLIQESIKEQVDAKTLELASKVKGFIRLQVDELKAQAVNELKEENVTFRNAQLFEGIKHLVAVEYGPSDRDLSLNTLTKTNEELEEEVTLLTSKLSEALGKIANFEKAQEKVLSENKKLSITAKNLQKQLKGVLSEREQLLEKVENFEKSDERITESSQTARILSKADKKSKGEMGSNPFLTEEILKLL